MRALFWLLLIANIAFAGWQFYQYRFAAASSTEPVAGVASRTDGVQSIVLLSELGQNTLDDSNPPVQPASAESGTVVTSAEQHVVADAASPPKQPLQKSSKQTVAEAESVATTPDATTGELVCHTLGPFRKLDKLREVTRKLKSQVLEASFRSTEERERSLFWVYLKPEADLKSAKNTTRMLRNKKIRDSYIIAEGKNRFGISLGHFRDKSRAYGLRDKVAKLGFDVAVEPVFRTYTLYWLDYKTAAGSGLPDILRDGRLDESVNRFDRDCP